MKKLAALIAISLAGCSTVDLKKGDAAMFNGRCQEAYSIYGQTSDPIRYYNFALVAKQCEKNESKTISFLNYGARLGEKNAIDWLLRSGLQVPAPDLVRQRDSSGDAALGLMFLQAGQARPAPRQQMICDTDKFGNGLQTICR